MGYKNKAVYQVLSFNYCQRRQADVNAAKFIASHFNAKHQII